MKAIIIVCLVFLISGVLSHFTVTDELISKVNSMQNGWTAGHNKFSEISKEDARHLLGTIAPKAPTKPSFHHDIDNIELPTSFDSRVNWPNCETMKQIRNQAQCGSCWAFSAAETMSDRQCVFNGVNVALSDQDILSCSKEYMVIPCGSCGGGRPGCAWVSYKENGVVSEDCVYYTILNETNPTTPSCTKKCIGDTSLNYANDKRYGATHYHLSGMNDIMAEIAKNGPVQTAFTVYEDFFAYTGGVYKHTSGAEDGGHAVKILGWGVDASAGPYWIVANSWDYDWGMNGIFWIARGNNECGIENEVWAGVPK